MWINISKRIKYSFIKFKKIVNVDIYEPLLNQINEILTVLLFTNLNLGQIHHTFVIEITNESALIFFL